MDAVAHHRPALAGRREAKIKVAHYRIFGHFPEFTPGERQTALLLFDGKKLCEMAYLMDVTPATVEQHLKGIAKKTHMVKQMNRQGIESGKFFKQWGFIRK
jgi:DNA-binding NarL/FixJ family response regulator